VNHISEKQKKDFVDNNIQRLVYSKGLLQLGKSLLDRKTVPDICVAVITIDASLEVMFNVIFDFYYSKYHRKEFRRKLGEQLSWPAILERLSNIQNLKPDITQIESLNEILSFHNLRNQIQHRFIIPTHSQLSDYYEIIKNIHKEITNKILDTSWESISIGSLIENTDVQRFYKEAESYYNQKQLKEAACCLVIAFEIAKTIQKFDIAGSLITPHRYFGTSRSSENKEIKELRNYVEKIDEEIEILKLGLNYKEFRKYHDFARINILKSIHLPDKIEESTLITIAKNNNFADFNDDTLKSWIVFAFDFVIRTILKWQNLPRVVALFKNVPLF
jgi:hypothetical protein